MGAHDPVDEKCGGTGKQKAESRGRQGAAAAWRPRSAALEEPASAPTPPGTRVLALDLGRRRIGLAVSDPLGITAQGLPTLQRKNRREDLEALRRVVEQQGVSLIVVGNPLHMSGHEGAQSESAAAFAAQLRRSLDRQVVLWDERLTTAEAQRVLRESGVGISKRAAAVDRMAAVILLQSYLDRSRFDD